MRTRTDTDLRNHSVVQTTVMYPSEQGNSGTVNGTSCTRAWRCTDEPHSRFKSRRRLGEFTFNPLEVSTSRIEERATYAADFKLQHRYTELGEWTTHGGFCSTIDPMAYAFVFLGGHEPISERVHSDHWNGDYWRSYFRYQDVEPVKLSTINRMWAKMSDSDFMSLVAIGEARETARMLKGAAEFFGSLSAKLSSVSVHDLRTLRSMGLAEMKALRFGSIPRGLRTAAQTWLSARYGWLNLYRDINAFVDARANTRSVRRLVTYGSQNFSADPYVMNAQQVDSFDWSRKTTLYSEYKNYGRSSSVSCGVMYRMNPSYASVDALGGRRVLSSIWEMIPYSFVVDWIIGVGEKIAALDSMLLCHVYGSWRTTTHNLVWSHSCNENPNWENTPFWRVDGTYFKDVSRVDVCKHVIREANPGVPLLPSINLNLRSTQVVDALSLLAVNSKKILALLRG